MTDGERWLTLVEDWQRKHDALLRYPLFENGWMQADRLPEVELLKAATQVARARMDAFIGSRTK
jgi:hypothetical protein